MTASQFWFCVVAIAGVGVTWTIVVCLLLNVHITTPFPAWMVPPARDGVIACADAELPLIASPSAIGAERSACPQCGAQAKRLGATKYATWFYCVRCQGNPWPVLKDDRVLTAAEVA